MLRYYETTTLSKAGLKYHPKYPSKIIETAMEYAGYSDGKKLDFLLDVGCGAGQATKLFCPYFKTVLGVDPSLKQLETAKENCCFDHVTFTEGIAEDLPAANESVDVVVSGSATHWYNVEAFLKETERVLKPGGTLVVLDYNSPKFLPLGLNTKNAEELGKLADDIYAKYPVAAMLKEPGVANAYRKTRYEEIFEAVPFLEKRYEHVPVYSLWSLDDAVGYVNSVGPYEQIVRKRMNDLQHLPAREIEEKLLELDEAEKFVRLTKECWNCTEKKNSEVKLKATFKFNVLLAKKAQTQ
uniref:putative methyltransferase DDB_G0268948 n=1 Tax=Ciona intestinalis TaxID=7719 RepID=UPI0002B8DF0A|nr:putative methyltransferase DDB_G0268948 [Ciona intestinalis]|eukprot:XP_004226406.1 putative methyltransferase DDB_G0268948 [Ciona intestinalis]